MADKFKDIDTSGIGTQRIAGEVESFVLMQDMKRKAYERRWYDNNLFDDGYHFRFVSRTTGKIVDLTQSREVLGPNRSIPKASRQIRGIANLLMDLEPFPVVYPQKINRNVFPKEQDPKTGQLVSPMYEEAVKMLTEQAQNIGHWITNEWKNQNITDKLSQNIILTAKNSVSYMQVWADPVKEKICTQVYDAFDIYAEGSLNDLEDSPMVVKAIPKYISQLKANEYFEEMQLMKINPDNKYASSEIKQAYMQSRFGKGSPNDSTATLILKEAYIKEIVNEANRDQINEDLGEYAKDFKSGDIIIRQVFEAGGVWLRDKYTSLRMYPIIPFTFEPGPLYQVPPIERFIPANKSLDTAMSRVERWLNTMVAGAWIKRKGENFEITNKAGGNVYEYETQPPVQAGIAPLPNAVWNYINELNDIIEEQGATTAALGQLPQGVKSGVAIETLKATDYANLKITSKQLRLFVKKITERMIDIAAHNFVTPQTVEVLGENNRPDYFNIIGEAGVEARKRIKEEVSKDTTIIRSDTKVDIEVESGLGFTEQARRDTMLQIIQYMIQLAQQGYITQEAINIAVKEMLHTFSFGSTQEFMQAIEDGTNKEQITNEDIQKIKIAVAEVIKDTGMAGQKQEDQQIGTTKVGVAEAFKDIMNKSQQGGQNAT